MYNIYLITVNAYEHSTRVVRRGRASRVSILLHFLSFVIQTHYQPINCFRIDLKVTSVRPFVKMSAFWNALSTLLMTIPFSIPM